MNETIENKIASIERCLRRINEVYSEFKDEIDIRYNEQDALILNIQRACQLTIDVGAYIVKVKKLGLPKATREIFALLENEKIIDKKLSDNLQAMVGFRNVAIHNYEKVNLDILHSIINDHLSDFTDFVKAMKAFI